MEIYIVKSGDTVYQIAQALLLEDKEQEKPVVRINGYAYPFISDWVLRQTLPFLTELSVFSYGFTMEGNLIPPALDDTFLIEQAHAFGARIGMHLQLLSGRRQTL